MEKLMALGELAFHPAMTADVLYRKAQEMPDEIREAWEEFAGDFLEIQALPVTLQRLKKGEG